MWAVIALWLLFIDECYNGSVKSLTVKPVSLTWGVPVFLIGRWLYNSNGFALYEQIN
uniref:Uncharacterized protein n=1 Tax=Anguilla anguilla TaxID=7936 RepID=A0A0E9SGS6_ANGAN